MTISEVKATAGITGTLALVRQFTNDEKPQPTEWVSHWDNDKRIRVTMHESIMETLKKDPSFAGLAVKKEVVTPADTTKAPYTRFVVITPAHIEATF